MKRIAAFALTFAVGFVVCWFVKDSPQTKPKQIEIIRTDGEHVVLLPSSKADARTWTIALTLEDGTLPPSNWRPIHVPKRQQPADSPATKD